MNARDELLALAQASAEAWAVVFAKDRLPRREVGLGFDPESFSAADYDAVADYIAPYAEAALDAPATRSGLRWRYEGESVLFAHSRVLTAPYDGFVARVDIAAAIRRMADYIGGASTVVSRDEHGRVVRQAERNLYLPQPNWMALSGGPYIDVCKLEVMTYGEDFQRIAWRTVHSPNGSAVHDDGTVTYERVGADRTRVTVTGLQRFVLPPFWAAAERWLPPEVKDALVEESYRRFFTVTLDNVEAAYEGRDVRVGHDPVPGADEPPEVRLRRAVTLLRAALPERPLEEALRHLPRPARPVPETVDADGFAHFRADDPPPGATPGSTAVAAWADALRRWSAELAEVVAADARSAGRERP